jgi:hypothetical protein
MMRSAEPAQTGESELEARNLRQKIETFDVSFIVVFGKNYPECHVSALRQRA